MPISPFLMESGLNNWPKSNWPETHDSREKCPICGNVLVELSGAIGSSPGHEHIHPGPLIGYNCLECMRQFSPDEILFVEEKKKWREMLRNNYWKNIRIVLLSPYLYIIAMSFMLISRSFWVGIKAGIVIVLLLPLLAERFNKPPDSPKTP